MTGSGTALPIVIERPSLCGTHFAKITGPHRIAGNGSTSCAQAGLTQAVVVEKEESFVLDDRAADGTTVIVAAQGRNGISRAISEPVVRIEAGVAEELIHTSVKLIGTGAPDHIDHRGTRKPEFRAEIRLLNFEFFHRLR